MSDKTELNLELKNLEDSLGRLTLPPTSIDRDDLMFQSGWAAAMASLGHESSPGESVALREANQGLVWRAYTVLATAAAILLGAILISQSSEDPDSLGDLQIAMSAISPAESGDAKLKRVAEPMVVGITDSLGDNQFGSADILSRVLEFPSGQVLKSGLAFRKPVVVADRSPAVVSPSLPPSLNKPPATQQQLMDELLPNRQRQSPAWRKLFLRSNTRS